MLGYLAATAANPSGHETFHDSKTIRADIKYKKNKNKIK
jgi:hypothetical protein